MNPASTIGSPRHALRDVRAWGPAFAFGLACLLLSAAFAWRWLPSMRRESEAVALAAADAQRQAGAARADASAARQPQSPAQRFMSGFPPADTRQQRVAAILDLARKHRLQLQRSDFKLAPYRELPLSRYTITMPLAGSYAQLRDFIDDVQEQDAALSLDHLRLRRASADAPSVDAELVWSIYMRDDAAAGNSPAPPEARPPR